MQESEAEVKLYTRRLDIFNAFSEKQIPLDLNTVLNFLLIAGELLALLDQDLMRAVRLLENAYKSKERGLYLQVLRREPRRIDQTEMEWINWNEVNFFIHEVGRDGVVFTICSCGNPNCTEKSIFYLQCGHHGHEGHTYKILNLECPKCVLKKLLRDFFEKMPKYAD